jgi:uncharacterized membrane protein
MEFYSHILVWASGLGALLIAGVFLAFSSFVMSALARLAPEQGMSAMNAINVTVINPLFMVLFLGTGLTGSALIVTYFSNLPDAGALMIICGALVYVIGTIGVTMLVNVPMNEALAAADAQSREGAALWALYLSDWTFWNHARAAAALISGVLLFSSL